MRRFRFPLARVQKLYQHRERAARLEMAEELSKLAELSERRKHVVANLVACGEETDGGGMVPLARAIEVGLTAVLTRVDQDLAEAEIRVERARDIYRDRRRDLLGMEKLRERRHETWRQEVEADEQSEFDEMGRLRFMAARKGGR